MRTGLQAIANKVSIDEHRQRTAVLGVHVSRSSLKYFANNRASSLIKVSMVCFLPTLFLWDFNLTLKKGGLDSPIIRRRDKLCCMMLPVRLYIVTPWQRKRRSLDCEAGTVDHSVSGYGRGETWSEDGSPCLVVIGNSSDCFRSVGRYAQLFEHWIVCLSKNAKLVRGILPHLRTGAV